MDENLRTLCWCLHIGLLLSLALNIKHGVENLENLTCNFEIKPLQDTELLE